MTDERLLADLDLVEGEPVHDLVRELQAAYVRDELPRVGPALGAVFTDGLGGRAPTAVPDRAAAGHSARIRRRIGAGMARVALGGAAVFVNLVGVGSAGWLPGPVQTVFERATTSVGIEVPASTKDPAAPRRSGGRSPGSPAGPGTSVTLGPGHVPPGQPGGEPEGRATPDRSVHTTRATSQGGRQPGNPSAGNTPQPTAGPGSTSAPGTPGTSQPCPSAPTTLLPPQLPPASLPGTPGVPIPGGAAGPGDLPARVDPGPHPCPTTTTTSTSTTTTTRR